MVDFIILEGATGDAYRYGLFFAETREVNQPGEGDEPGKVSYVRTLRFESPKWSSDFDNRVGYIGDNGVPGGIAVDGDGKLDVVLNVTVNGEVLGYLVLTSADEVICAYGFYYRAMIGLKEDGSFSFSSSAAESGVATFYKDENRDAQYNELAESKLDENENVVYFVNGEAADEDAFTAVINAQNEKVDVTFVPATAENLALYLTIE